MRNTMSKESLVCFLFVFIVINLKKEAKDSPFLALSVNSICKKAGLFSILKHHKILTHS